MPRPNTYPVRVYNTSNRQIGFTVNQGPAIVVPAAAPPHYAPGTPAGAQPELAQSLFAGQGQFFIGANFMTFDIPGGRGPIQARADLSNLAASEINACALYLFVKGGPAVSWVFLINGQPVAGNLSG